MCLMLSPPRKNESSMKHVPRWTRYREIWFCILPCRLVLPPWNYWVSKCLKRNCICMKHHAWHAGWVLNRAFERHQKYRACFSNSTACRPPHVNLATLRNALFRCKVLDSCAVASADDLFSLLEKANTKLMNRPQESWPLITKARALSKARSVRSDIFNTQARARHLEWDFNHCE
jgi:hypothetical protein